MLSKLREDRDRLRKALGIPSDKCSKRLALVKSWSLCLEQFSGMGEGW